MMASRHRTFYQDALRFYHISLKNWNAVHLASFDAITDFKTSQKSRNEYLFFTCLSLFVPVDTDIDRRKADN